MYITRVSRNGSLGSAGWERAITPDDCVGAYSTIERLDDGHFGAVMGGAYAFMMNVLASGWRNWIMVDQSADDELLFEVATPLGFHVRVTRAYWELIITVKHPVMAGHGLDVQAALTNPDEIRLSRSDPDVYFVL